ncbi:short chain oxidoreductase [Crassisporium funariophilum]|nr:short chain oxidoreductase [Crassisporium funariophilum]
MAQPRVALITGSAQGIGRAIALRLADDGFDIGLTDIAPKQQDLQEISQEIITKGRKVFIQTADASVEHEVKALIDAVVDNLGGLDVMVANAGICLVKPFLETTVEDWDRIFSINVRGLFFAYQYAAKVMIKQGRGGRIIGACSGAGKQGTPLLSAYSSTKFAVRGLTQSAASELGKHGITVNAYAPGAIVTPMLNAVGDSIGDREGVFAAEAQRAPVGYIGKPEDVTGIVSYFASKESHFVTGQTVGINGGRDFD